MGNRSRDIASNKKEEIDEEFFSLFSSQIIKFTNIIYITCRCLDFCPGYISASTKHTNTQATSFVCSFVHYSTDTYS